MRLHGRVAYGALLAASLTTAVGGLMAANASAAQPQCGVPITTDVTLKQDLVCAGDGLVIGADGVTIVMRGFSIRGSDAGVGVKFNGHFLVRIFGGNFGCSGKVGAPAGRGQIKHFATGMDIDGDAARVCDVTVAYTTNDGIEVTGLYHDISSVTAAFADGNGIDVQYTNKDGSLKKVRAFGNGADGIHLQSDGENAKVRDSVVKQNGGDGLEVEAGDGPPRFSLSNIKAVYNVDWGIAAVPDGDGATDDQGHVAFGNGQLRQCLWVQCN